MKGKLFIYVTPLILGAIAMVLTLKAPQHPKGREPQKVSTAMPAQSDTPAKPEEQPPANEKTETIEPQQPEEPVAEEKTEEPAEKEAPSALTEEQLRKLLDGRAGEVSQNPLWLEFIAREDAIIRMVKTVDAVAAGDRPLEGLDFLKPQTPFSAALGPLGFLAVAPAAIARFQQALDAFRSFDLNAAAKFYLELEPALDKAFHDLGYSDDETFRRKLTDACTVILKTPIMKGEGEITHVSGMLYRYANPQLEELLPVQKLLMRLGEKNREDIRSSVSKFATILELYAE